MHRVISMESMSQTKSLEPTCKIPIHNAHIWLANQKCFTKIVHFSPPTFNKMLNKTIDLNRCIFELKVEKPPNMTSITRQRSLFLSAKNPFHFIANHVRKKRRSILKINIYFVIKCMFVVLNV